MDEVPIVGGPLGGVWEVDAVGDVRELRLASPPSSATAAMAIAAPAVVSNPCAFRTSHLP